MPQQPKKSKTLSPKPVDPRDPGKTFTIKDVYRTDPRLREFRGTSDTTNAYPADYTPPVDAAPSYHDARKRAKRDAHIHSKTAAKNFAGMISYNNATPKARTINTILNFATANARTYDQTGGITASINAILKYMGVRNIKKLKTGYHNTHISTIKRTAYRGTALATGDTLGESGAGAWRLIRFHDVIPADMTWAEAVKKFPDLFSANNPLTKRQVRDVLRRAIDEQIDILLHNENIPGDKKRLDELRKKAQQSGKVTRVANKLGIDRDTAFKLLQILSWDSIFDAAMMLYDPSEAARTADAMIEAYNVDLVDDAKSNKIDDREQSNFDIIVAAILNDDIETAEETIHALLKRVYGKTWGSYLRTQRANQFHVNMYNS